MRFPLTSWMSYQIPWMRYQIPKTMHAFAHSLCRAQAVLKLLAWGRSTRGTHTWTNSCRLLPDMMCTSFAPAQDESHSKIIMCYRARSTMNLIEKFSSHLLFVCGTAEDADWWDISYVKLIFFTIENTNDCVSSRWYDNNHALRFLWASHVTHLECKRWMFEPIWRFLCFAFTSMETCSSVEYLARI